MIGLDLLFAGFALGAIGTQDSSAAKSPVVVIPVHGKLSEGSVAMTVRGIRDARRFKARAVFFDIDTDSGEPALMDRILSEIESLEGIPSVAYVRQRAFGPGAVIAITCDRLYMRPGSQIGSGLPASAPLFPLPGELMNETRRKEILDQARALVRSKAQRSGRNQAIALAMIDPEVALYEVLYENLPRIVSDKELAEMETFNSGKVQKLRTIHERGSVLNLTAHEAFEFQFIDAMLQTRDEALSMLELADAPMHELSQSWSETLVEFTQRYSWLLLAIGLIALFIELKVPGFGVPGIVGLSCLGFLLFGKYLAGVAEIAEILLIVLGVGMILVEVLMFPGATLPAVLGTLFIVLGLVLSFQRTFLPGDAPTWTVEEWWQNTRTISFSLVGAVFLMIALSHYLTRIPLLKRIALRAASARVLVAPPAAGGDLAPSWQPRSGEVGSTLTPLRPVGKIDIQGRQLEAVTEGQFIEVGVPVRIVRIDASKVVVEPVATSL